MKAGFARAKQRYVEKVFEQNFWPQEDAGKNFDLSLQGVFAEGVSMRVPNPPSLPFADHSLESATASSLSHRPSTSFQGEPVRDFVQENKRNASSRPRSAASRSELSAPRRQPLSKIMRMVKGMLRRNQDNFENQLDLSSFRMEHDGASFVAQTLVEERLSILKMVNCELSDQSIVAVTTALQDMGEDCTLEELHLGVNAFSLKGLEPLTDWLRWDGMLRVLDLQLNKIGDLGCKLLAHALEKNAILQGLNLQGNNITDEGVRLLVRAMQEGTCVVQEILLGYNPIQDAGARELARLVVEPDSQLLTLDVAKTELSDEGGMAFVQALDRRGCTLQRIDISYNCISEDVSSKIKSKGALWINMGGGVYHPGPVTQAEQTKYDCDAKVYLTEGPLEKQARRKQAEAARKASLSSAAARKHIDEWRTIPPPVLARPETRHPPAPRTGTLQKDVTLGALYGGRLAKAYLGDIRAYPKAHYQRGPLTVQRDPYQQTMMPINGPLKYGEGLDFLKEGGERGTVYGQIGGQAEGLRAVAQDVGMGRSMNKMNRKGLKGAPMGLWQGKD